MSKKVSEQTSTEAFARQFELAELPEQLRKDTLTQARSVWASQAQARPHTDSLVPYVSALAATLLMIVFLDVMGLWMMNTGTSNCVITIRPSRVSWLREDLSLDMPDERRTPLNIIGISRAPHGAHFTQLQTMFSQGDSP